MPPVSFTDLYAEVERRRGAGDIAGAVALLQENLKTFPLHQGVVHLVLAELLAGEGKPKEALVVLQQALTAGARYKAEWLTGDAALKPIADDARFTKLVAKFHARYTADAAAAHPDLLTRAPAGKPGAAGWPLLVALHGNNSNARETARAWSSAVELGWVVAIPQSSEIGASPDAHTWNDRERTATEIRQHLAHLKKRNRIDPERVVLAGFSMGGLQAIALPLERSVNVRGIVPVAAWLPHVRGFAQSVTKDIVRELRAYVVVGEKDPSAQGAKDLVALLKKHGAKAKLDARKGLGHEYPADMKKTLANALEFVG